jgi:hypothetical protein
VVAPREFVWIWVNWSPATSFVFTTLLVDPTMPTVYPGCVIIALLRLLVAPREFVWIWVNLSPATSFVFTTLLVDPTIPAVYPGCVAIALLRIYTTKERAKLLRANKRVYPAGCVGIALLRIHATKERANEEEHGVGAWRDCSFDYGGKA